MQPFVVVGTQIVPTYLLCGIIGLMVSMIVAMWLLSERGSLRKAYSSLLISFPTILLGGRLFSILSLTIDQSINRGAVDVVQILDMPGSVYWGGLLAYIFTVQLVCHIRHVSIRLVMDVAAVCIPLFHSVARIGCYFAGCCYGIESELFGIPYRVTLGGLWVNRVPVQLIESAFEFVMFVTLFLKFSCRDGLAQHDEMTSVTLIEMYLAGYACFRFLIEFVRGDMIRGIFYFLSFSQYISIISIIILIIVWYSRRRSRTVDSRSTQVDDTYKVCNGFKMTYKK